MATTTLAPHPTSVNQANLTTGRGKIEEALRLLAGYDRRSSQDLRLIDDHHQTLCFRQLQVLRRLNGIHTGQPIGTEVSTLVFFITHTLLADRQGWDVGIIGPLQQVATLLNEGMTTIDDEMPMVVLA